ncbi:cytochrome oxidase assembly protein SHY1 [Aspergillus luchuensis]|uniref:SURF1-like protein n=1 Tax=Aspergillus kawachii TaxID=1069201 RepID=A0A7R7WLV1_ASPKA|nr:surf-like protein [Aspergillus luchuensis]BCS05060.1 surf-like protein [Aspergillus luchuensis]BCS16619.1 surf-like protein [Aspergillus luchuensis]GAA85739.1 COX1 assembly protein Shy1 [Aspergillus luchuensis IFO 4308]
MRSLLSVLSRTGTRTTPLRPASSILRTALNRNGTAAGPDSLCTRCLRRTNNTTQLRFYNNNQFNDDQRWLSVVDAPSQVVRTGRKHGPGLIILALIPIISFALGTWQIQRLEWKTNLIAKFEDRLIKPPLPLPPRIDPSAISEFDYRRVVATGTLRHDQEMLVGPRMREGQDGFFVVTPLEREGGSTVLVNRGWISRKMKEQRDRLRQGEGRALPEGEVVVEGLLREPWKKNMFTPDNVPAEGKFYFPDIEQMAELTGSQPVWIEETMVPDMVEAMDREAKGIPIGRAAEVNLKNNHSQYIFTWYGLSLATSIMLWMIIRKRPNEATRRVRHNRNW